MGYLVPTEDVGIEHAITSLPLTHTPEGDEVAAVVAAEAECDSDSDSLGEMEQTISAQYSQTDSESDSLGENAMPLWFFFDIETTGLDIYSNAIIDLAAKVVDAPVPVNMPSYESLVRTSKTVPDKGKIISML